MNGYQFIFSTMHSAITSFPQLSSKKPISIHNPAVFFRQIIHKRTPLKKITNERKHTHSGRIKKKIWKMATFYNST